MKIKLVHALSLPHPDNPKKNVLHRAGTVLDLEQGLADRAVQYGAAVPDENEGEPDTPPPPPPGEPGGLPERPSSGAAKEKWSAYLDELEVVTEDLCGPLEVPEDAKRDDMIRLGDERVEQYNAATANP